MKRFILLLLASCLTLPACQTMPSASSQAPPDFAGLETAWNNAHLTGDTDALDALWADDITIIVPGMPPFDKETSLRFWHAVPVHFSRYATSNVDTRVHGDCAIVTGMLERARDFGGRTAEEHWQFMKVYVREGGRWRVTAYQASEAPSSQ